MAFVNSYIGHCRINLCVGRGGGNCPFRAEAPQVYYWRYGGVESSAAYAVYINRLGEYLAEESVGRVGSAGIYAA